MRKKNKIIKVLVFFVILFAIYNLIWFFSFKQYSRYNVNFEENIPFRSYYLVQDGYNYNVKFPDYLSFTGNLGITLEDNKMGLIIWPPSFFGKTEYGVIINEFNSNNMYQIEVDENMNPIDPKYKELIDKHKEEIEILYQKSKEMWGDI